jgi:hypothetical protein
MTKDRGQNAPRESGMEWVIVGMEAGVALVIGLAIYLTTKK